ncbi:hypothetical protein GCM10010518_13920 [Kitasatospora cinereorecta]
MVQNPSVRPGRSPRARPTGAPQSEREQNRFRSGTSGFSITAVCGSGRGTSGTSTRPAPSRPRPDEELVELPAETTDTEREAEESDSERESRPETERLDVDERDEDLDEAREPVLREVLSLPRPPVPPPAAIPVGGELSMPVEDTTGARPHVSQYSSPPPMSS